MTRLFYCFCLAFLVFAGVAAQDIPIKEQDRNTYSFSMPEFITVQDFELVSAVTTENPDVYLINVRALTPDKKTDTAIKGKLLFEINGQQQFIDFKDGVAQTKATIKGTDKVTLRAVDSNITRTGTIQHPWPWAWIGGGVLLVGLGVYFVLRRRK